MPSWLVSCRSVIAATDDAADERGADIVTLDSMSMSTVVHGTCSGFFCLRSPLRLRLHLVKWNATALPIEALIKV